MKRPQYDPNEIQARLLELQGLMLEAQRALSEADEEHRRLRATIEEKEKQLRTVADLEFLDDGQFYTRRSEDGRIPYCPICWGEKDKLIPLVPGGAEKGYFTCAIPKVVYTTDHYKTRTAAMAKAFFLR